MVDQASEAALANDLSLEVDLRKDCPNVVERGLVGDFSFMEVVEGECESLKAFVKLHFFEGVLSSAGAEAVER